MLIIENVIIVMVDSCLMIYDDYDDNDEEEDNEDGDDVMCYDTIMSMMVDYNYMVTMFMITKTMMIMYMLIMMAIKIIVIIIVVSIDFICINIFKTLARYR